MVPFFSDLGATMTMVGNPTLTRSEPFRRRDFHKRITVRRAMTGGGEESVGRFENGSDAGEEVFDARAAL